MKFGNFFEARRHAKKAITNLEGAGEHTGSLDANKVDKAVFDYFFSLQGKIEKLGEAAGAGMDYHIYAEYMWRDLVGELNEGNQAAFNEFKVAMIKGLHGVDMKEHTYDHVVQTLSELIARYHGGIKHIVMWSTGDVAATGYQVAKIDSSRIINDFHRALKRELPEGEAGRVMKEQTSYFVADNKFDPLVEYAEKELTRNPGERVKIVIIEDSKGNFSKAEKALKALGDRAAMVDIIPIWATYSREGTNAEKAAQKDPEEAKKLAVLKEELNAISSFEDMLKDERFKDILANSHLFVDFDGVIGNNISMRETQAKVIYDSLMSALTSKGESVDAVRESIIDRVKNLPK